MKKIFIPFVAVAMVFLAACNANKTPLENSNSNISTKAQGAANEDPAPLGPVTSIEYPSAVYDFGNIDEGEKVTHEFEFKNTGNEPLVIANCKASCGCTVPDWPRDPIPTGGTGKIKVQFDSSGKGGPDGNPVDKRITVTANTNPVQTFLTIKGKVKSKGGAASAGSH